MRRLALSSFLRRQSDRDGERIWMEWSMDGLKVGIKKRCYYNNNHMDTSGRSCINHRASRLYGRSNRWLIYRSKMSAFLSFLNIIIVFARFSFSLSSVGSSVEKIICRADFWGPNLLFERAFELSQWKPQTYVNSTNSGMDLEIIPKR